jgi:hypothetical protein
MLRCTDVRLGSCNNCDEHSKTVDWIHMAQESASGHAVVNVVL